MTADCPTRVAAFQQGVQAKKVGNWTAYAGRFPTCSDQPPAYSALATAVDTCRVFRCQVYFPHHRTFRVCCMASLHRRPKMKLKIAGAFFAIALMSCGLRAQT